jgi:hypothetical protein
MGFLRSMFGPSQSEIWEQLAAQVGGSFQAGGFFGRARVETRVGEWTLTLDTYTSESSNANGTSSSYTYTRLRAPYVNADGFRFTVYQAGFFTGLGKLFGMQDLEIGDPAFDEAYVLKGNDEEKVRRFFLDDTLKRMIYGQSKIHMSVKDDEGWFRKTFPDNVDELYFERAGVMKDLAELSGLFDLFSYSLCRLCQMGSAYEKDPGIVL